MSCNRDNGKKYSCVLFDLDGTLIDSAAGIIGSLEKTIQFLGLPVPDSETMLSFVGPPLDDTFIRVLGMTPEQAKTAVEVYRKDFDIGAEGNPLFPGVERMLRELQAAGMPLAIATSKPRKLAEQILDCHGISECFTVIQGAGDNEEDSQKSIVVGAALRGLTAAGADVSRAVMVGDRVYDAEGAAAHGLPTILVSWGYATEPELAEAPVVVSTVEELAAALMAPLEESQILV